jgi:hypothetical protein
VQPPKIFEGENEYRAWLKERGLTEAEGDDYQSQTGVTKRPPVNDGTLELDFRGAESKFEN